MVIWEEVLSCLKDACKVFMLIFKDKYVPSIPSGPHDNCPNLEILMHQRRGKY
jgi:hypothetical protein